MNKKLQKLGDLFGHDLAGWQITHGHFLQLSHGLMGTFPAIDENGEIIVVLDKSTLAKVWQKLERREAKVTSIMIVARLASGTAFIFDGCLKGDAEPLRVFSAEDIEALCQKKDSMRWAPGLIQLSDDRPVRDPVFT